MKPLANGVTLTLIATDLRERARVLTGPRTTDRCWPKDCVVEEAAQQMRAMADALDVFDALDNDKPDTAPDTAPVLSADQRERAWTTFCAAVHPCSPLTSRQAFDRALDALYEAKHT